MLSLAVYFSFINLALASYGKGMSKLYLPAPPGERPPCAKEGETYCDEVDYYPA